LTPVFRAAVLTTGGVSSSLIVLARVADEQLFLERCLAEKLFVVGENSLNGLMPSLDLCLRLGQLRAALLGRDSAGTRARTCLSSRLSDNTQSHAVREVAGIARNDSGLEARAFDFRALFLHCRDKSLYYIVSLHYIFINISAGLTQLACEATGINPPAQPMIS
jgi:hypothetical protein